MDFLVSVKSRVVLGIVAVVFLGIGTIVGMLISQGLKISGQLTYDGIANLIVGLVAVVAATVVLPVMIQPLFRKHKSITDFTHENIKVIVKSLNDALLQLTELNATAAPVTIEDRKLILSLYNLFANYSEILSQHANEIPALSGFSSDIAKPVMDSKSNFADVVVPDTVITDVIYLPIKDVLEKAIYDLIEMRYKLN
ncbi:MAG TPA: hypothetical protein VLG09_02140 [Candidatus Saccharimonadales bacterium]|nr:hypothetical protein [Candidatus Saccharimonadales bacterium]